MWHIFGIIVIIFFIPFFLLYLFFFLFLFFLFLFPLPSPFLSLFSEYPIHSMSDCISHHFTIICGVPTNISSAVFEICILCLDGRSCFEGCLLCLWLATNLRNEKYLLYILQHKRQCNSCEIDGQQRSYGRILSLSQYWRAYIGLIK